MRFACLFVKKWVGVLEDWRQRRSLIDAFSRVATNTSRPPMRKTQAPQFWRMMLGDFEVTALNDGVVTYRTKRVLPPVVV
jgi:hypothetical protein